MKLRNKKTGNKYIVGEEIHVCTTHGGKIEVRIMTHDGNVSFFYPSFEKMLKEWEDYKPAEPLIKDEKIRKAVRAWAEAEEIEKVFICDDLVWGEPMVRIAEDTAYHEISFKGSLKIKCGTYTITELCGKEEE